MTSVSRVAYLWRQGEEEDALPAGVEVLPFMPETGRAASRTKGIVHMVDECARITDGSESRIVATWLCGGSAVDAMEVLDDSDPLCTGCQLAQVLPSGPCVYRAWNAEGVLLYIGSTMNPVQRIRAHASGTPWWPEVSKVTFEEFENEGQIRRAESTAIWNETSVYNRGGTRPKASTNLGILAGIEIESNVGDPQ